MLQQIMTAPGEIIFKEVPVPEPKAGEVLLKIMKIGVCGTDIHVYHGKHAFTKYPVTQGHEVAAKIAKLGEGVTKFHVGQKVIVEPQVVCGECWPCRHGMYNLCEAKKVMGFQAPGMACEYFLCEQERVIPVPDNLTFNETAMLEPLAVTVHASNRAGDLNGLDAVVFGAGPIGILLVQTLKAKGVKRILATDISDYRLSLAKECGADFTVNTKNEDFTEALLKAFGPDKADIMFDCAGNDITINQAIRNARKGSRIILIAQFAAMANCDLATLDEHEIDLNTSLMYKIPDFEEAIALVSAGKIHLKPLMSKHYAFKDYLEAYKYIDANRETTMKVLIDVDPSEE